MFVRNLSARSTDRPPRAVALRSCEAASTRFSPPLGGFLFKRYMSRTVLDMGLYFYTKHLCATNKEDFCTFTSPRCIMQPYVPRVSSDEAKDQAIKILSAIGDEMVAGMVERLRNGKFDGSRSGYDFFAHQTPLGEIKHELKRFLGFSKPAVTPLEPVECYTFNIKLGDTPETNSRAKELLEWCKEALEMKSKAPRLSQWSGSICGMDGYLELT